MTKTVYKLFRLRKDGSLGPLFIGAKQRINLGEWMEAQDIPTQGYARRPGWHSGELPYAPHLSEKGRVWCECEVFDIVRYSRAMREVPRYGWYPFKRPSNQGGEWIISGNLKVNRILSQSEVDSILSNAFNQAA